MGCIDIALENYKKAVALAPENLEYNAALTTFVTSHKIAEAKNTEGATGAGTAVSKEKEKIGISYEDLIKKGDEAYKKQNFDEAIDSYTKAVVIKPQDKITMLKIANLYKVVGNNTKALNFYDKVLVLEPENADAFFNKGLVYASLKNYDSAIQCFDKVIQLTPNYPYAYYSIGLAYEQKGDVNKALEYYYLYAGLETDEKMQITINQKIKSLEGQE